MRTLFCGCSLLFLIVTCLSQAPQGFNYQAILRNENGIVRANEAITLQISIVDQQGIPSYTEAHDITTNELGLVNVVIGQGNSADDLSAVDWTAGPYYLDLNVNGEYLGSSPLLSVPYALFAESGNEGPQGPPGPQGEQGIQGDPGDTKWSETPDGISYPDGNVGIGTENPQTNLHIHGSPLLTDMRGQLSLSSPLGQDVWLSFFEEDQYSAYLWWDATDGALRLQNRSMGDLSLNSAGGNVGIGTKDPLETLHVNGNARIDGDLIVKGNLMMKDMMAEIQMLKDLAGIGTVTDIDGNAYRTVRIGDQIWMAENLKVTHYNDGTPIDVKDTFYNDTGALMWYDFDINNKDAYGGIYSYRTDKNVCPVGWHVSTWADWGVLINFIGGTSSAGKLLETGTTHWTEPNEFATNETGFTALPAGFYYVTYHTGYRQSFRGLGEESRIWAPNLYYDPNDPTSYYDFSDFIILRFDDQFLMYDEDSDSNDVTICGSIRCVKD